MKKTNVSWVGSRSWVFFVVILFLSVGVMVPVPGSGAETEQFIPDSLVALAGKAAIVVDKTMQRLFVYRFDGTSFRRVYETNCSTGKNQGTKIQSGDARTPEGIYFPTQMFRDSELSATYGPLAFDLSYPNILDRKEGKNGNNIWLHGTDKPLTPFQSNGCIALENGDITAIADFITIDETPVIIQDYIRWVHPSVQVAQRDHLMSFIDTWAERMCSGSAQQFSGLYGEDCRYDSKEHALLTGQILALKGYGGTVTFVPRDLMLLKHDKYAMAWFRQEFTVNDRPYDAGSRKLFLKKWRNNWFIAGDVKSGSEKEQQFLAALDTINNDHANRSDIAGLIDRWLASWRTGNMEDYASFYGENFRSKGMNRQAWLDYKEHLARINRDIRIDIKNLKISRRSRDSVVVSFEQHYRSSRVKDVGIKKLYLKYVDNSWKICQEIWNAKR